LLFALGTLGWLMKHGGWPRAPALVGFVLSGPMEQYFWLSNQIHGWSWLARPGVLIIASIIVIPLVLNIVRARREVQPIESGPAEVDQETDRSNRTVALVMAIIASAIFVYAFVELWNFNPASRLMPALAIFPGLPLVGWLVIRGVREYRQDFGDDAEELRILAVLILYAIMVWAIGFSLPTLALLAWMLLMRANMRVWTAAMYGTVVFAVSHLLFNALRGEAPVGALVAIS
jgi:hypothetical protein